MTEKTKHSRGPWKMEYVDLIMVNGYGFGANQGEKGVANAHLIAAAPEMYALLEQVVNAFEDTEKSWANFEEQMMFFCVDAQKLIEKIKGE